MNVLITGVAGFIGFHLAKRLLHDGHRVAGIDNVNDYYDVNLKENRLKQLSNCANNKNFTFHRVDLADTERVLSIFQTGAFSHVVNLAAQPGVRYSLINPKSYLNSNILGFGNILEGCRHYQVEHLVYASSSSVYGLNKSQPYSVHHNVDHPISLYAATKKSNELMAHVYSHLFAIPCTGLRFFTVYGPWGRPDMALHLFTDAIVQGRPIKVFNHGHMRRDFTYIDDIIESVVRLLDKPPHATDLGSDNPLTPYTSSAPWRVYNIGNNKPIELSVFIETLEQALHMQAKKEYLPMQPGDVEATWADIDDLVELTGFAPSTSITKGIQAFVDWYKEYYKV